MARTRQQDVGEDWSCPLCTLLNTAEDDHCAACDNARPLTHELRKPQPPEPSTAVATASKVQHVYCPTTGVFFSSLPRNQSELDTIAAWRQEPRLIVNRRRGIQGRNISNDRERKVERKSFETTTIDQNTGSTATQRDNEQEVKAGTEVESTAAAVEPMMTMENGEERQEEVEDIAVDVEEPCFNLLGSGASVFAAPAVQEIVQDQCATDETKSRDGSEDADDEVVVSSPPRYPGFMPASKVLVEEPKIEEKLASAGLSLSDSEDEEKPKQLRRRTDEKDDSWEDKWVCQICTNLNDQTMMECSSCSYKRYRDNLHSTDTSTGSCLRWACHNCTNLNPPDVTDCLMCLSTRKMDAGTSNGVSNERWKCLLCATFNAPGTTRCEVCERSRDDEAKKAAGKGRQCPVCTNINSPGSTRCELCDSLLHTEVPDDHFVDLSSSPPGRKSSYTVDEGDLENPYADLSQYNDYDATNEVADADPDFVEEISDNEQPSMSLTNTRPLRVRSELKEFEHFVCMEDLRSDYGCRVNYSKMFAGQRSRKSYADRLATRQAESRKRKRAAAARKGTEGGSTPTSRGGKPAKGGKKRKAGSRRASAGGAKAPRGKRAKKNGTPTRRASSATTYSSGINHYDDSAATFGEDLNTMAWEGLGSAGYL